MTEEDFFALVKVAREQQAASAEQQKAVEAAAAALAAERAALAKERAALVQAVQASVPALQQAVSAAVGQSLAGAGGQAARAVEGAVGPVLARIEKAAGGVSQADETLRAAATWVSWKWIALCVATAGAAVLAMLFSSYLAGSDLDGLREQRAELESQIAVAQVRLESLEKKGGKIVLHDCEGRVCVEASADQGKRKDGSKIALGSWTSTTGKPLVIPKGY